MLHSLVFSCLGMFHWNNRLLVWVVHSLAATPLHQHCILAPPAGGLRDPCWLTAGPRGRCHHRILSKEDIITRGNKSLFNNSIVPTAVNITLAWSWTFTKSVLKSGTFLERPAERLNLIGLYYLISLDYCFISAYWIVTAPVNIL